MTRPAPQQHEQLCAVGGDRRFGDALPALAADDISGGTGLELQNRPGLGRCLQPPRPMEAPDYRPLREPPAVTGAPAMTEAVL
jgi:hypothetical protein